jgi:hypothetical protein
MNQTESAETESARTVYEIESKISIGVMEHRDRGAVSAAAK